MQIDTKHKISSSLSEFARTATGSKHTPDMRLELLKQNIRWNLEQNVRHKEDGQRGIVFRAMHNVQVFLESQDSRVTDVDSARKGIVRTKAPKFDQLARDAYRSKNASRYNTHKHGRMCQSILAISLRSVVAVSGGSSGSTGGSLTCGA